MHLSEPKKSFRSLALLLWPIKLLQKLQQTKSLRSRDRYTTKKFKYTNENRRNGDNTIDFMGSNMNERVSNSCWIKRSEESSRWEKYVCLNSFSWVQFDCEIWDLWMNELNWICCGVWVESLDWSLRHSQTIQFSSHFIWNHFDGRRIINSLKICYFY